MTAADPADEPAAPALTGPLPLGDGHLVEHDDEVAELHSWGEDAPFAVHHDHDQPDATRPYVDAQPGADGTWTTEETP